MQYKKANVCMSVRARVFACPMYIYYTIYPISIIPWEVIEYSPAKVSGLVRLSSQSGGSGLRKWIT